MKTKLKNKERGGTHAGRRPRKHTTDDLSPLPHFWEDDAEAKASKSNITADDCAWLGEDGNLDPDDLLKKRGYEPEGPLRLILGAIIDAHSDSCGRTRAQRIDDAEAVLLGVKRKRGNDPRDDEDVLRELGRRYFRRWLEDPEHEIEVAPIAREILNEARVDSRSTEHSDESAVRRLRRRFLAERDRILARGTTALKWSLPEFHDQLLTIVKELQVLGVGCDPRHIIERIDPGVKNSSN